MRIVVPKKVQVWSPGFSRRDGGIVDMNKVGRDVPIAPGVRAGDSRSSRLKGGAIGTLRPTTAASGFTMVEIAIAVAVIAFALVAIIGILPAGLQVQKENREDTLMAQDGTYFMEAIR